MRRKLATVPSLVPLSALIVIFLMFMPHKAFSEWRPVWGGKAANISGIALIRTNGNSKYFLVVHDNKKSKQERAGVVAIKPHTRPRYIPLKWPGELPVDLESLTAVPDKTQSFMAMTSKGRIYHISVNAKEKRIVVLNEFSLPDVLPNTNFEGFALQKIGSKTLAVWGHRGKNEKPGMLFWGYLSNYVFSHASSTNFSVPWPVKQDVRHISDLKVDKSGTLFISCASDPGDDGPFQSAIYSAGVFTLREDNIEFRKNTDLARIYKFPYNKVEALELVPEKNGGMIFGTDDENMGASIYTTW